MKEILMQSSIASFPLSSLTDQRDILKGKSGVYGFINLTNGCCYIGSGVDLWLRLLDYQQPWYLKSKGHLPIIRAILKYGMSNFIVVILEFTTRDDAVAVEQSYISKYNPAYNILRVAGSSVGYKHSDESKLKISEGMTDTTWTDERREEDFLTFTELSLWDLLSMFSAVSVLTTHLIMSSLSSLDLVTSFGG